MDLSALIEPTLGGLGHELVAIERAQGLIRIFIDRVSAPITVEDCALVSNHLSRLFAVESVDYKRLEISSPGLDRLLTKAADFARFTGEIVKLKLRVPHLGQHIIRGVLEAWDGEGLTVSTEQNISLRVLLSQIDNVRLDPKL